MVVCVHALRLDKFLRWLPKPNTTLLLYPDLGPTINIGEVSLNENQVTEVILKILTQMIYII